MGCFVQGGKKWHGMFCPGMFYPTFGKGFYDIFVAVFLGYNQYWPDEFIVLWFLCPGTPGGSTGSGSGFKVSQKVRPRL